MSRSVISRFGSTSVPLSRLAVSRRGASSWRATPQWVSVGCCRRSSTATSSDLRDTASSTSDLSHLNPTPDSYSSSPFTDRCTLTLVAGNGGHGCVSFLREKYIALGPPNGGDGGSGGNIFIQAAREETSLHKLARRGQFRAGRGQNGQGKNKGGQRGEDVLLRVPVGTVVREVARHDPVQEEEDKWSLSGGRNNTVVTREKWLLHPGSPPSMFFSHDALKLPPPRRSHLQAAAAEEPLRLDLDKPMDRPMLLAAGAMGGLGNPHFVTQSLLMPKVATKGDGGMRLVLQLELKLLADVGLVGLPNAGKSTLLRSLSNSRARVGDWAFTTLSPNIGTIVLDNNKGRPTHRVRDENGEIKTRFTIADIPGLIEDAHLDKGLGLGFLRHVERAGVLAFVIDLSAGDAVAALKALWREVAEYDALKGKEINSQTERYISNETTTYQPFGISPTHSDDDDGTDDIFVDTSKLRKLPELAMPPIKSKPWFVVATKADLPKTQENFIALQNYLQQVQRKEEPHPSGDRNAWRRKLIAVPVSAVKAEGVTRIPEIVLDLLDG